MERLTQKALEDSYVLNPQKNIPNVIVEGMIYNKLGHLENIEEELGCFIKVLIEALKNGIWTYEYWDCEKKENKNKLKHIRPSLYFEPSFEIDKFMFNCGDHGYYSVKLKDYKKTWWLKEDKSE